MSFQKAVEERGHTWIGALGKNRFVTSAEWNGKTLVHIREWFESDGKLFPGKRGISFELGGDQLKEVVRLLGPLA